MASFQSGAGSRWGRHLRTVALSLLRYSSLNASALRLSFPLLVIKSIHASERLIDRQFANDGDSCDAPISTVVVGCSVSLSLSSQVSPLSLHSSTSVSLPRLSLSSHSNLQNPRSNRWNTIPRKTPRGGPRPLPLTQGCLATKMRQYWVSRGGV